MKEMSRLQAGMSLYGEMPDNYSIVLNSDNPIIARVLAETESACAEQLKPIDSEIRGLEARKAALEQSQLGKKKEEIPQDEKDDMKATEESLAQQKDARTKVLSDYAAGNGVIHQLIDLALLQNGMLRGEALDKFLSRSLDMIK